MIKKKNNYQQNSCELKTLNKKLINDEERNYYQQNSWELGCRRKTECSIRSLRSTDLERDRLLQVFDDDDDDDDGVDDDGDDDVVDDGDDVVVDLGHDW